MYIFYTSDENYARFLLGQRAIIAHFLETTPDKIDIVLWV